MIFDLYLFGAAGLKVQVYQMLRLLILVSRPFFVLDRRFGAIVGHYLILPQKPLETTLVLVNAVRYLQSDAVLFEYYR